MSSNKNQGKKVKMLRCPNCGGEKLTPLTGRDLTLKEILAT